MATPLKKQSRRLSILSTHPFDDCPIRAVEDLFTLMKKRIEKLKNTPVILDIQPSTMDSNDLNV